MNKFIYLTKYRPRESKILISVDKIVYMERSYTQIDYLEIEEFTILWTDKDRLYVKESLEEILKLIKDA